MANSYASFVRLIGALLVLAPVTAAAAPSITETGWSHTYQVSSATNSAVELGRDGALFWAQYIGSGDIWRRGVDGVVRKLDETVEISGIVVAPDGDLFYSEISPGDISRITPSGTVTPWLVDTLHAGDDDPAGIDLVPLDYTGTLLTPGEAVVVDPGYNADATEALWAFSLDTAETVRLIYPDDGTLVDPRDITVSRDSVFVVEYSYGKLWRLDDDGTLVLQTVSPSLANPIGVAFDPSSDDLIVADAATGSVLRLTAATAEAWTAAPIATGFTFRSNSYDNVFVSADGAQLAAASDTEVTVFSRCDATTSGGDDCDDNGVYDRWSQRS